MGGKRDVIMDYVKGKSPPRLPGEHSLLSLPSTKSHGKQRSLQCTPARNKDTEYVDEIPKTYQTESLHDNEKIPAKLPKAKIDLASVISYLPEQTRQQQIDIGNAKDIGNMRIEIVEARLTLESEWTSKRDPYVVCETQELRIRTRSQRAVDGRAPKWN
jgi:hypothetical protein